MTLIYYPEIKGVPGVPSRWEDQDARGWLSGSVSIPIIAANGGYEFKIPAQVVGVIIGLADTYSGIGYGSIAHALYFSHGTVVLLEYGRQIAVLDSYGTNDKFVLWRGNGRVYMLQNGVKISDRPQLIHGPFRLASTLYMKSDAVVDAKIATLAVTSGEVRNTLSPVSGLSMTGHTNWMSGELSALGGESWARGNGAISAIFPGLIGLCGDGSFANINTKLASVIQYIEAGSITPSWGEGRGELSGVSGVSRGLTGEIGGTNAPLRSIKARLSDYPYGEIAADLGGISGFSAQAIKISFGLLTTRGQFIINGSGFDSERDAPMTLPAGVLAVQFGGSARLTSPMPTLAVGMTIPAVGRGAMTLPSARLWANGTSGGLGSGFLTITGTPTVVGSSGAQGDMRLLSGAVVSGAGKGGAVGGGSMQLPGRYVLRADGVVRAKINWTLTAPALQLAPTGQAWLVAPSLRLFAAGGQVVAVEREAYAINLTTGAVTHYTNYPFDNVLRFGDRFFGVKADGVFELVGETDDGVAIDATVKTFQTDFGTTNFKRVASVYLTGRMPNGALVSVQADEGDTYEYVAHETRLPGTQTTRAVVGRGIKGTYYAFTIENVDGGAFELDHAEVMIDKLTRAL